jgi:hypothetical protein
MMWYAALLRVWEKKQMEQKLYGATHFLNPTKFSPIKEENRRDAARGCSMMYCGRWFLGMMSKA